ncbi:MAG TPA: HEAT repeat domain-containing protein [Actinomycetota bacterium]|nr:HEAT repeat domain-containing protein [Actinomycetota bacterium]
MWRKYGDDLYAAVVLAVFSIEAVTLGALTWIFVLRLADDLGAGEVGAFLAGSLALTAAALLVIGVHILGYHVFSSRRERGWQQRLDSWTERWVGVLFDTELPPPSPLPREAVESLLDLRETLVGTEGERLEWLMRRYGLAEELLHRSRAVDGPRPSGLVAPVRRRRLSSRLDALEALAKARVGEAIEPLIGLLGDREPAVRIMSLRSLARTLARVPEGAPREAAAERFAEVIVGTDLPSGAIEESLLLLEATGPSVLGRLLSAAPVPAHGRQSADVRLDDARLAKVLDAVGRLKVLPLVDQVAPFCGHPNPEVRAAALRALGMIGILPPGTEQAAAAALIDPVEYVRIQATRTASLLPRVGAEQALWTRLADESWWVRRAAAQTLLGLGADGPSLLERAGREHDDRYARHMAVQVLLDRGHLDPARARRLRAFA